MDFYGQKGVVFLGIFGETWNFVNGEGENFIDRTTKLLNLGYKVFDSCYEDFFGIVNRAKQQGHKDVVPQRVKTDTNGLKMFFVWVK